MSSEIEEIRFNLIHEHERTGESITNICRKYGVSRKSYYKWKKRYLARGIDGLKDLSRRPHDTTKQKVTPELEQTILGLRLDSRFGTARIKFRLKRLGVSLSSRTVYKVLKRHGLNRLSCKLERKYRRFSKKHPNDMVQMDILGPFYLSNSSIKNYIISCIDDCTRKVVSRWTERKRGTDVLDVLQDWMRTNGKPKKVMHDNGKQFVSKSFRQYLKENDIKDKPIPAAYPQLQGKVEAYNKIVKNEFLAVENIIDREDGKARYAMFVYAYNMDREHGGIGGQTPQEKWLQLLNTPTRNRNRLKSVTHVCN
ncbi:MAG TPA: IS481 family transposase [Nitrososphaera sp.]